MFGANIAASLTVARPAPSIVAAGTAVTLAVTRSKGVGSFCATTVIGGTVNVGGAGTWGAAEGEPAVCASVAPVSAW